MPWAVTEKCDLDFGTDAPAAPSHPSSGAASDIQSSNIHFYPACFVSCQAAPDHPQADETRENKTPLEQQQYLGSREAGRELTNLGE